MDVSGLVQYNNSEGGSISSIVFQKLGFFQDEYRYSPLFKSDYTGIGALVTHEANTRMKRVLEKQARQQSTEKRKQYTNFSQTLTEPRLANKLQSVTMHLPVKIEGGAKIGTAHLQR